MPEISSPKTMANRMPPNILLIHCHDLGRHLGCYGVPTVSSPNLDALADRGVRATGMFAAAPQCSPSRAALFTGRWPHANGVMGLTHRSFAWDLNRGERHLAAMLHDGGYHTELLGVHHESRVTSEDVVAAKLGFDRVQTGGMAGVVADRSIEALGRAATSGQPFYLQVGFIEPHRLPGRRDDDGVMGFLGDHIEPDSSRGITVPPYLVDNDSARAELAELQGAIHYTDNAVGRVLGELDRLALTRSTIVIFTTDHGLALPRAKCSLYDPGLEIAFIARWPDGGWEGGRALEGQRSNVDVVPTLLEAVDLADQATLPLHGSSFVSALSDHGSTTGHRLIFAEMTYHDYYDPRRCVRTDEWKLIANFSSAPGFMDPSQSWLRRCTALNPSYSNNAYHPSLELYDLRSDPLETHDLAADPGYRTVLDELATALATWMSQTSDPLRDGSVGNPLHDRTQHVLQEHLWSDAPSPHSSDDLQVQDIQQS